MPALSFDGPLRADRDDARLVRTRLRISVPGADHHVLVWGWGDRNGACRHLRLPPGTTRRVLRHAYAADGVYRLKVQLLDRRCRPVARLDRYVTVHSGTRALVTATHLAVERHEANGRPSSDASPAQVGIRLPLGDAELATRDWDLAVLIGASEIRADVLEWRYRTQRALHFGGQGWVEGVWPCRFRGRWMLSPRSGRMSLSFYLGDQSGRSSGPDLLLHGTASSTGS